MQLAVSLSGLMYQGEGRINPSSSGSRLRDARPSSGLSIPQRAATRYPQSPCSTSVSLT